MIHTGRVRGITFKGIRIKMAQDSSSKHFVHVNLRLIHINVWRKLLQYCKVISLQLIKIIGGKKSQKKKKDSDRAITPAAEAVRVPAHLASPRSPQAKQLRHIHPQLSLGQSCHRQKKSCISVHRVTLGVSDFVTLQTVACQASLSGRGVLQAITLVQMGQYWLPYPSRAPCFLLP